jgi:Flp pilus assembly pilin Flp
MNELHSPNHTDGPTRGRPIQTGPRAGRHQERGANLVEYALLMALIALVAIGGITAFGGGNGGLIDTSANSIVSAG